MASASYGYGGPNPGTSGRDPRGRGQNQSGYQQARFETQQGPVTNAFAQNYGRASTLGFGDYNNIMGGFGKMAGGANNFQMPGDKFGSYGGMQEFSKTGGFSPEDISNIRARAVSPIRSAYSSAQREVGRQRSLQGGYAPNAIATQAKMAREQGQGMSDATTNAEAGIAEMRNRGRQFGLTGMGAIEGQRNANDFDLMKMNQMQQMGGLQGMAGMYGSAPGMASQFGNQLLGSVQAGGQFGNNLYGNDINNQRNPGQFEQTVDRTGKIIDAAGNMIYPWLKM